MSLSDRTRPSSYAEGEAIQGKAGAGARRATRDDGTTDPLYIVPL